MKKQLFKILILILIFGVSGYCDNNTELVVEDDLTINGTQGTYLDPDVELKGFVVIGATQPTYTANISTGPGNVIINGTLGVSSGAYIVGNTTITYITSATFSGASSIFIKDGSTGNSLRKAGGGYLEWYDPTQYGDNLGNHIATMTLTANYGIVTTTITASTITSSGYVNAARYLVNNSTMVAILPGTNSIAYGVYAGTSNTGNYNVFIGNYAGTSNTTGWANTATGSYALFYNQTGSQNTVSGYKAGGYGASAVNSFSSSTIIGAQAGYNLTTGSGNIFLGWSAGYNVTSGTGNIIIGYNQNPPAADTNNFLNIGGLIYGTNMVSGGSGGFVGISTNSPQARLDVKAAGSTASDMAQIWRDSSGVIVGSMSATGVLMANKFLGDASGLTGIATLSNVDPYRIIKAKSSKQLVNAGMIQGDNSTDGITVDASSFTVVNTSLFKSSVAIQGGMIDLVQTDTGQSYSLKVGTSTTAYHLVVSTTGNVGIGTTSPGGKLHVSGGYIVADGNYGIIGTGNWGHRNPIWAFNTTYSNAGLSYYEAGTIDYIHLHPFPITPGTGSGLIVKGSGNVGIGTTGPTAELHVSSSNAVASSTVMLLSSGTAAGQELVVVKGNGNVGIGTTAPGAKLEVVGGNIRLQMGEALDFGWSAGVFGRGNYIGQDYLSFFTAGNERLYIDNAGNVGIGTTGPTAELHVSSSNAVASSTVMLLSSGTAAGQELVVVKGNGNVGIGTTAPGAKLQVNSVDTDTYTFISSNSVSGAAVVISTSGNVGIGTASPGAQLHVKGGAAQNTSLRIESDEDYESSLRLYSGIGGGIYAWEMSFDSNYLGGALVFDDLGDSGNVIFDIGGNVGIGTTSPGAKLEVAGDAKIAKNYVVTVTTGSTLSTSDYGNTIIANNGSTYVTFTLPSLSSSYIGARLTFVKLGTAGMKIQTPSGNYIADSTSGGSLYTNESAVGCTISLMAASSTNWVILGGDCVWQTN